jgi:hypothetical protein
MRVPWATSIPLRCRALLDPEVSSRRLLRIPDVSGRLEQGWWVQAANFVRVESSAQFLVITEFVLDTAQYPRRARSGHGDRTLPAVSPLRRTT